MSKRGGMEWPPKRAPQKVHISRQEPPPEVKEGSRAESAGLKLGDAIVTINQHDTSEMTLQEANAMLEQNQQANLKLGVIKFDEVDDANPEKKPKVHNIVLEGKRGTPKLPFEDQLRPPREACIEKPIRKSWHPIVWPHPEHIAPDVFSQQQEKPHLRIIRNLRKLLTDVADKPQERDAHLEQLLLILPRGSADPLEVIRPKVEPNPEDIIDEEENVAVEAAN